MKITTDPSVAALFQAYPPHVAPRMAALRALVIEVATDLGLPSLTETLKWGEPSYLAPKGSTLRMDWKAKTPDRCALYFQCSSRLVDTFRMVYGDQLLLEGKRAILLPLDQALPIAALRPCIQAALTYHEVKHLELLGIEI